MWGDIALIFVFILIGGTFAAAEMAMVTLRESQVKQLATKGKRGRAIERLTSNPNLFLSAVQIGVTVSGMLSAAFGGATNAEAIAPVLIGHELAFHEESARRDGILSCHKRFPIGISHHTGKEIEVIYAWFAGCYYISPHTFQGTHGDGLVGVSLNLTGEELKILR